MWLQEGILNSGKNMIVLIRVNCMYVITVGGTHLCACVDVDGEGEGGGEAPVVGVLWGRQHHRIPLYL